MRLNAPQHNEQEMPQRKPELRKPDRLRRAVLAAPVALSLIAPALVVAQDAHPSVDLTNGPIKAKLWLPDAQKGYYRAMRFDWSGSINSLTVGGHEYFGIWTPKTSPMDNDRIDGPVEDYWPLNYEAAKPGETFVKIGVGTLKKADDTPYRFQVNYERLDTGKWSVTKGANWIEYRHVLNDPASGYGYIYTKRITLTPGKPQMTIDHTVQNTGTKTIDTNVYNHGFFMLDRQPTGPDTKITFAFKPVAERDLGPAAKIEGNSLVYVKELVTNPPGPPLPPGAPRPPMDPNRPTGAQSGIVGFSTTDVKDFDIRVENTRTGAGVRFTADVPLTRINYWSVRTTACPEAYVAVKAAPGASTKWRLTYDFYSLKTPPVA